MRRPVGYPENPRCLADHFLRWRKQRGLLQRDAALRMGVQLSTYITWERGGRRPSIGRMPTVIRQLGYDPAGEADGPMGQIENARRQLGWSLRRTAECLNVDQGTLTRWRIGVSSPTFLGDQVDRFLALPSTENSGAAPEGSRGWSLGKHLWEKREQLGLSRPEVAKRLGTCRNSVLNWENDRQLPEVQFWPALIHFLKYDPSPAPTTLAELIEAQRRRLGWTYRHAAGFIGVDDHTLLRWTKEGRVRLLRRESLDHLLLLGADTASA